MKLLAVLVFHYLLDTRSSGSSMHFGSFASLLLPSLATASLIVCEPPQYVRPYILPNLEGRELLLGDDVFRLLVTKNSSGGAFTLLGTNGQTGIQVTTHYHANFFETFFLFKGGIKLWATGNESRYLLPGDFGSVPHDTYHAYQVFNFPCQ